MSATQILSSGNQAQAASVTVYNPGLMGWFGRGDQTTEANGQAVVRSAGVFSVLVVRMAQNDRGAGSITFRKNGADGNMTVSIGASGTGQFFDATHTDTVAAGDLVGWKRVTGAGGTIHWQGPLSVLFTPTNGGEAITFMNANTLTNSGDVLSTASTTFFIALAGNTSSGAAESLQQLKYGCNATLRNYSCYISTNGRSTTSTAGTRINGSNGTLTVSIGASATGMFEDTTHSDAVVTNDLVNHYVTLGTGTGNLQVQHNGVESVTIDDHMQTCGMLFNALLTGVTHYWPPTGRMTVTTTEVQTNAYVLRPLTLSGFGVQVSANTNTATTTITSRKNSAAGNQTLSVGSGSTGFFQDTTHTDSYASGDQWNYQIVVGATGTTFTPHIYQALVTYATTADIGRRVTRGIGRGVMRGAA